MRILDEIDINDSSELRYDTWVLHTLWARMDNQQPDREPDSNWVHLSTLHKERQPLYAFCNRSPKANTAFKMGPGHAHSTNILYAKRQTEGGERIRVSYSAATAAGVGIEGQV